MMQVSKSNKGIMMHLRLGAVLVVITLSLGVGSLGFTQNISSKELNLTKKAAEGGNKQAQVALAISYAQGLNGIKQNDLLAEKWYEEFFKDKNGIAQYVIAEFYEGGPGKLSDATIPIDYKKALFWYEKAWEKGYVNSANKIAQIYEEGKDGAKNYTKALEWYKKSAAKNNSYAQYWLGMSYSEGLGGPHNIAKAMEWYKKSCENDEIGKGVGCDSYIKLKENGTYTPIKGITEKKTHDSIKAAETGDSGAQLILGDMYNLGLGVNQSSKDAYKWYEKAAIQGNIEAQLELGSIYAYGRGVHTNYIKAHEWYQKAADQGDATAYTLVAYMYFKGQGVRQDFVKARELYGKACDSGFQAGCDSYKKLNELIIDFNL